MPGTLAVASFEMHGPYGEGNGKGKGKEEYENNGLMVQAAAEVVPMLEGSKTQKASLVLLIEHGASGAKAGKLIRSTMFGQLLGTECKKRGVDSIIPGAFLERLSRLKFYDRG